MVCMIQVKLLHSILMDVLQKLTWRGISSYEVMTSWLIMLLAFVVLWILYFTRIILSNWYYCCSWCCHLTYIMCFWLLRNLSFSFRVGANEWSLMHSSIPHKLQSLYNDGYKLVCLLFWWKTLVFTVNIWRTLELLYETSNVACCFFFFLL